MRDTAAGTRTVSFPIDEFSWAAAPIWTPELPAEVTKDRSGYPYIPHGAPEVLVKLTG